MPRISIVACAVTTLALATIGGTTTARSGLAPSGTPTTNSSDFDGDGFADLAIGAPFDDVSGHAGAGVVNVLYGRPQGLGAAGDQVWSQDSPGVGNSAEAGDHFGWALATGDFDGDGFADLAIGIPGEDVTVSASSVTRTPAVVRGMTGSGRRPAGGTPGLAVDAGAVQVLLGGPSGLSAAASTFDRWAVDAVLQAHAQRGYALATLEWYDEAPPTGTSPDGLADLAIGWPGWDSARGGYEVKSGRCYDPAASSCLSGVHPFDTLDPGARGGSVLAAGDLVVGPFDELAVGAPRADTEGSLPSVANAGLVAIASSSGGEPEWAHQGGPWPEAREAGDHFGAALAIGDVSGDGRADLIVGVPDENSGGKADAGLIEIWMPPTSGSGLPSVFLYDQAFPGSPGARRPHARFGAALAVANFGKGSTRDIAIGVPGWDRPGDPKAGAVVVVYSGPAGPALSGNQLWTQDSPGVADASEAQDRFGSALWAGDFGRNARADLAIGTPHEGFGGHPKAGIVQVLYAGSPGTGLTGAGDQRWTQDSTGIGETAQDGDRFGGAVQ